MTTDNTTAARKAGLTTLNHIETVRALAAEPETMTALAARLSISTAAVTGIADKLEKLGLIERIRGAQDRRSVWLKLTPAGQALAAKLDQPQPATV